MSSTIKPKDWWIYVLIGFGLWYISIMNFITYEHLFDKEVDSGWSFRQVRYLHAFNLALNNMGGKILMVGFYVIASGVPFAMAYKLFKEHKKK